MMNHFPFDTVCLSIGISNALGETNVPESLHLIVWPPVVVLFFLCVLIALCGVFGCKYTCRKEPPVDVVVAANRLEQLGIYTLEEIDPEERERMLRELALTSRQVADCVNVPVPQPTTDQLHDPNTSIV